LRIWIAHVAILADADRLVPGGIAYRVHTTLLLPAGVLAGAAGLVAIFIVGAVIVTRAFYDSD